MDLEGARQWHTLRDELRRYLSTMVVHRDNIGRIRCDLFMPFDSVWNGLVRDETAAVEQRMEDVNGAQ